MVSAQNQLITDIIVSQVLFESEWIYLVLIMLLAASNGYVGSITMMFGPKVAKPEHQEVTAAFLIAALVIGCGVGAVISTPVVKML